MAIINFFPTGGGSGKDIAGAVVTLGSALEYTGAVQTQTVSSVALNGVTLTPDTDYVVIGNTGTDVGNYQLTVLGLGNYSGYVTAAWSISKAHVAKPTVSAGTYTYDGSAKGPTITGFDPAYMNKTGDSETNAGNYTLVISLADSVNSEWSDGTTAPITRNWSIDKAALIKPAISNGTFTYAPSTTRTPTTDANFDSATMTKGGDTSATNAGDYTLTVSLRDTDNYEWAGGGSAALSLPWKINKAQGTISVSPTSLSLFGLNTTGTSTITKTGDGAVTASSSATGTATASISGNTVTVTAKGTGSATITVTLADGDNYLGATATISATVTVPNSTLANNTPDVIQAAAKAGVAASTWSVGDKTAEITFQNKTVGALSFNGLKACAFILGFDHNSSVEGTGIHFQFGKTTGGVDIAWCDSNYNSTGSTASFRMNTTNTNVGGWKDTYMRGTICPAFLAALPAAWQNVIVDCTKYTDNTGNKSTAAANVTATSDKIWLLNHVEVFGDTSGINTNEGNKTVQYTYYANGNSKVKYKHNGTTTACYWWLRSPNSGNATNFRIVGTSGSTNNGSAYGSYGFAPGFKVA